MYRSLFVLIAIFLFSVGCSNQMSEQALLPSPTGAIIHDIPFTCQAPEPQDWKNPVFADGCEEACLAMLWSHFLDISLDADEARRIITALSKYEKTKWGFFEDASAEDTGKLLTLYPQILGIDVNFTVKYEIVEYDTEVLKKALLQGKKTIIHVNATRLHNPYYRNAPHHAILAVGLTRNKIICNDPATKNGEAWAYPSSVLEDAVANYPSGPAGRAIPDEERKKVMILVWRE